VPYQTDIVLANSTTAAPTLLQSVHSRTLHSADQPTDYW
jgi:hypothetical protein